MHERLKNKTRENHQLLEKTIVAHIRAIRSPVDYTRLLETYYSFIYPVEQSIRNHFPYVDNNYQPVLKSDALKNDILSVDKNYIFSNQYYNSHYIKDYYSSLGALYVLEGSVLGGQVISKMIARSLGREIDAFRYFNFYGEQTMEKWTSFKNYLENTGFTDEQKDCVIDSANDTFEYFRQHFSNTYAT